ncbi:GNAT family N-acetyltransferase [Zhihengliuella flava]|uniref:Acetyltransferase n=1 Tax=Zhihengliuella flava TaxID=1285193 RepID=A0A931DCS1_9MICC|nr:N-acetyltransferase [Zhihengliuella flava]MBG6084390.1 putative acetyltransferase [Zhihengliuella flava]
MQIRLERAQDTDAIRALIEEAFVPVEHSDGSEPRIVDQLRRDGDLTLSLVADDGGTIVGHIAFSPVSAGRAMTGWFGLGPVSVAPHRQGEGIGRALIEAGLAALRERGAAGCALLGDPALYSRFGFASGALTYQGLPPEYIQHLTLDGSAAPHGELTYAPAFG